jgi:histone H3/H4
MVDQQEFRKMLTETFSTVVASRSFYRYDSDIIDELQKLAVRVSQKTGGDIEATQAVSSAKTIAETAAAIAQGAGKVYITWADVEAAIEFRFCTVFPFCSPEP